MKLAPTLALALLAACSAPRAAGPAPSTDPAAPGERPAAADAELAAISRGMTQVDDAERRGEIAAERARWTTAALQDPADRKARFLAIYAMPHGDDGWAEFKYLAKDLPGSALGWVGMARLYVEWRVLDQLPRTLEAARLAEPGNWLVDLVQAQGDERAERWEAAAAGYRAVLRVDPANVDAHVGLARLARRAGDAATARAEADAALSALPDHVPALMVVAELAAEAGDAAGAAAAWFRVVAASPKDRAARVSLAKLLKAQGDVAGARDQWKAAVALREDVDGLVALADASRASGDKQAEQQALERLSQIDPSGAEWKRIAEIRLAAGDQEGAEKALRRAQARDPKDPKVALALGRVVLQLGKPQEALELLRAAGAEGAADREALERRLNVGQPARGEVAAIQRAVGVLIDRTYRARLKELPRLSGKLSVRVTVDGAGGASLVEVLEDTVHDDDVTACAYWNLRDAAYPPSKPGRYSFSFTLQAGR